MAQNKFALGAVVAAVAAFAAGVLSAPKSGKETRQDLKEAALKTKKNVVDEAEKAKVIANEKAQQVKHKAEDIAADVKTKADDVVEDVTHRAADIKARAEQAVEGAKKGYAKDPSAKKK